MKFLQVKLFNILLSHVETGNNLLLFLIRKHSIVMKTSKIKLRLNTKLAFKLPQPTMTWTFSSSVSLIKKENMIIGRKKQTKNGFRYTKKLGMLNWGCYIMPSTQVRCGCEDIYYAIIAWSILIYRAPYHIILHKMKCCNCFITFSIPSFLCTWIHFLFVFFRPIIMFSFFYKTDTWRECSRHCWLR
jgi:hypothetical protein